MTQTVELHGVHHLLLRSTVTGTADGSEWHRTELVCAVAIQSSRAPLLYEDRAPTCIRCVGFVDLWTYTFTYTYTI